MNPQAQKYTDPLTQPGYTKEYGYNTPPLGKINSDSLSQAQDINFQTQPTPQPYNIASLGNFTPMQPTPQETQASELTKRIQGFNQQLAGQSEFKAQQEQQLGVPELTKTQKDLESRLTALKNESLAIPLQVQQDFRGVGATRGGVQPIETGKLRENAIQALSVNSLLEASRGNLTLAQDMVDKAVAQKYDPIKEQIAINTANLDLILKDPATSRQDKDRAEQQKRANEERASAIAKKEEDEKSKRDFTIKILANNPNLDPLYVKALEASKSYEEVVRVANTLGLNMQTGEQPASVKEYEYAKRNGYTGSFSDYQNEDANRKRSIAAAGVANQYGMGAKETAIFNSLVDKQNKSPLIAANDRATILKDVTSAVENDPRNASLQVSFVYSMIQALDTYQSAVREGEIGLISGTQGLGDKIANLPSKILQGNPLSEAKVKEYVATSKLLTDSINKAAETKKKQFSSQANISGIGQAFNEYQKSISGVNEENDPLGIRQK